MKIKRQLTGLPVTLDRKLKNIYESGLTGINALWYNMWRNLTEEGNLQKEYKRMAHELNIDKKMVGLNVERILDAMVVKKYWQPEDGYDSKGNKSYGPAYRRALEDATAGYRLTPEDYRKIADDAEQAYAKRMNKRAQK